MKRKPKKVLLIILLAVLAFIMVFPMVVTVLDSFMPGWEAAQYTDEHVSNKAIKLIPSEVTLEQYERAFIQNSVYWDYFWNSVLLTVSIVIGQVIISTLAAYAFTMMKNRWKEWLFFLYIVVMLLPFLVTLVPAYLTADALGIMNTHLSIILPGIFSTFGVFLLRQHMEQIPKSYIEAARMDGAGHGRVFFHVMLPLSKTTVVALAILCFIDNWNMMEQALVFLSDTAKWPLSLYFSYFNQFIQMAFAASVVFMLPMLLIFMNGEKQLMEGIKLSGIK
jgi:multiple sugar transport system permease protein